MELIAEKIAIPELAVQFSRARLLELLKRSLKSCHATIISGRAGTGKTVLALDFARQSDRAVTWYKVDAPEAELKSFFQYLIASIRKERPYFGAETLMPLLRTADTNQISVLAEAFVYEFVEGENKPLLIVIEDLHLVCDSEWLVPFFRRLLPLLPSNVHMLITSRTMPPAPLWRMRAKPTHFSRWPRSRDETVTIPSRSSISILPLDLREQLARAQAPDSKPVAVQGAEIALKRNTVTDLTINMLGPVQIVRDPTRPLGADAWTTRRARDILCFITSRRHHRASKETIIDAFWGETDLEAVEKNFHPTVSHIRKALNSNQPLKQNFVLYREGAYQLSPEFSYRIDIEEFDRLMGEGENARRARDFEDCIKAYEAAVALYRGEFMQGSYEPWVEEQRAYYREQYLRLLESLAGVAQKMEDWAKSIQLAQRILHEDQFREDIHCLIMRALGALGNRGAVREHFEGLKRLLHSELGVEPGSETRKLYEELMT